MSYSIESCWVTFTIPCSGNQTRHTVFPQHIATHQRSTHPLQAGDIHFITTSPLTARQALMFGGPVEFHLVFRWEVWLSKSPACLCVLNRVSALEQAFPVFAALIKICDLLHYTAMWPWQISTISGCLGDRTVLFHFLIPLCKFISLWRSYTSFQPLTLTFSIFSPLLQSPPMFVC